MWKIPLATVKDNGPDSLIEQHVTIKQPGMVLYRDNSQWCIIKCWSVPCWDVAECFARNILFGLGMTSLKQNFTLEDLNLQLLFWGKQKRFLGILSYDKIESFNVKQIAMADVSLVQKIRGVFIFSDCDQASKTETLDLCQLPCPLFEIHKMINLPASVKIFKNKLKN